MNKITRVDIKGFKSIKDAGIDLCDINVLIGANGAGKSNFISFFKMLNRMITESLQLFISREGGANSLLYYGAKTTPRLSTRLTFNTGAIKSEYEARLADAAPDTLGFVEETVSTQQPGDSTPRKITLGAGQKETLLGEQSVHGEPAIEALGRILRKCDVFQFHDTSETAKIRREIYIDDNQRLRKDAGNIAAYLYMLKKTKREYYRRIIATIRLTAPHFSDFELEPSKLNPNRIILNWKEVGSDYLFGPHQLPDGLLRFMALTTLFLQPENEVPEIIVIDEPELGLHPYALNILIGMVRKVSHHAQVILATQSVSVLDQFESENIIVVERDEGSTRFKRPDPEKLEIWLEEYSLGELWEKNVIGGRPRR